MTALKPLAEASASETAAAFERLAAPLRREVKLHCYRMLGSLHEAEDLVQETYLRAWSHFGQFEGRGAFRAWLYQIATNACLNALARRRRQARLLPHQLGPATADMPDPEHPRDIAWLEPYPDTDVDGLADPAPGPEARLGARQAVQLAFIALIQELPARQRAVLLLCDVMGWSAAETATLLGGSTAAVNSALQRARATLARRRGGPAPPASAPPLRPIPERAQASRGGRTRCMYLRWTARRSARSPSSPSPSRRACSHPSGFPSISPTT